MGSNQIPSPPRGHGLYPPSRTSTHSTSDSSDRPASKRSSRGSISCASQQGAYTQTQVIEGHQVNSRGEPVTAEQYIKDGFEEYRAREQAEAVAAAAEGLLQVQTPAQGLPNAGLEVQQQPSEGSWGGSSFTDESLQAVYPNKAAVEDEEDSKYHLPSYYTRGPTEQPLKRDAPCPLAHLPAYSPYAPVPESYPPLFTRTPLNLPQTPIEQMSFHTVADLPPAHTPASTSALAPITTATKRNVRALSLPFDDLEYCKRRRTLDSSQSSRERIFRRPERRTAQGASRLPDPLPVPTSNWVPMRRSKRQLISANLEPPINLKSLSILDATAIIRNGQLRHDLLFEPLAFRPINTKALRSSIQRGQIVTAHSARQTCDVTEMFWESIRIEIETGCRCSRWIVSETTARLRVEECICGKWEPYLTEDQWWDNQKTNSWPSRIPPMITALRKILDSLMGSTTPCPDHFAHSFSPDALREHEMTCPTVTHALVPKICKALDGESIARRARGGTFDPELFTMLADAMKVHCAPIRDAMVDKMLSTALGNGTKAGVVYGLRECFDCLEAMKLDIANHQVQALRPRLWDAAPEHERFVFQQRIRTRPINQSDTFKWIQAASQQVLKQAAPADRIHLTARCACNDNGELVIRAIAHGCLDLIFHHDRVDYAWPPMSHKRQLEANAFIVESDADAPVPESIKFDAKRLRGFYADAVEIAIVHMLVTKGQQLMNTLWRPLSNKERRYQLSILASCIEENVMTLRKPNGHTTNETHILAVLIAKFLFSSPFALLLSGTDREAERTTMFHDTIGEIDQFIVRSIHKGSEDLEVVLGQVELVIRTSATNCLLHTVSSAGSVLDGKCANRAIARDEEDEDDILATRRNVSAASNLQASRDRRSAWIASMCEERDALIKRNNLRPVEFMLNDLAKRIDRVLSFHAGIFSKLYVREGMVFGLKRGE